MNAVVRLLGAPSVETEGAPVSALRGRKSWALLALLLLADRPPSRQRLAALLFPDAEDPLGALRWSLADLRRTLSSYAEIAGDPVTIRLSEDATTDIEMLAQGVTEPRDSLGGELLQGINLEGCPAFETWLQVERHRLASAGEALLRERALRDLSAGRQDAAVRVATALVGRNPLDETNQVLLVRCLAAAGSHRAAADQVRRCEELFDTELGTAPSPALRAAADARPMASMQQLTHGSAAAAAQLEAGQAAVNAGAIDAGLQCLRRAVAEAEVAHDVGLRLRALIALGGALVHGVRGRDEEGAAVLHEALAAAESTGDQGIAARAMRELGFIDVQAGRRQRADQWLSRAVSLVDSEAELAAVLGNAGMNQSDMGRYADALATLTQSVEHALIAGSTRQAAWSTSLIGRIHVLRGDTVSAVPALERSIELVRETSWTAFAPWPESLRAEVDRAEGRRDRAAERYDHAFALACQLADPCWEGIAARGTGLLTADSGDVAGGMHWLTEAGSRCMRWPDAYQWVHAYVLDATCELAVSSGQPDAAQWVDRLAALAARGEMNEFIVRSHAHRARLGQAGAAAAAVQAAADVDNPSLHVLVSSLDAPAPEGAPRVPVR